MKTVLMFTLPLIALILIAAPLVPVFRKSLSGKQAKHRLAANLCAFFGFCILAVLLPAGGAVSAAADHGPCGAVRKSGVQQRAKRSAHRAVCAVQKDLCHLKHPMLRARSEGRPGVLPPSG